MRAPAAFLSYVHTADFDGRITELRQRLEGEIRIVLGHPFAIFQDKEDIAWGQAWRERIEQAVDAATFFLPILTPGYFTSESCRTETEQFLKREKALGRRDLILPIYYVDAPLLNERSRRVGDALAELLAGRQWFDWRPLRADPFNTPEARRAFAALAMSLRDALERVAPVPASAASKAAAPERAYRVDPGGRGDFTSITEALRGTRAGARIQIAPGFYREAFVVRSPRELIGEGDPADVVIAAPEDSTSTGESKAIVHWKADTGRIANLTIRGGAGNYNGCVQISEGRLILEGCDLETKEGSCIYTFDGSDPRIRRNTIHGGTSAGIVLGGGHGIVEDNRILENRHGIAVLDDSAHLVRRNRIFENRASGIWVISPSHVRFEENEILDNGTLGIAVMASPSGTFIANTIIGHPNAGLAISDAGGGTFRGNRFARNDDAWRIDPAANARVTWEDNVSE